MTQRKAHNEAKAEKARAEDRIRELYEQAKKLEVPSEVGKV